MEAQPGLLAVFEFGFSSCGSEPAAYSFFAGGHSYGTAS